MTIKNLSILKKSTADNTNLDKLMSCLKGKPFYCSSPSNNSFCCLWHCSPPKKPDNSYSELYLFQSSLVGDLQVNKRITLLKARNLGSTESP